MFKGSWAPLHTQTCVVCKALESPIRLSGFFGSALDYYSYTEKGKRDAP